MPHKSAVETERRCYSILGLDEGSPLEAVRKAYRDLALRYHPDKNPNDAAALERFKDLNDANQVLSDPKKKQMYDMQSVMMRNAPPPPKPPVPRRSHSSAATATKVVPPPPAAPSVSQEFDRMSRVNLERQREAAALKLQEERSRQESVRNKEHARWVASRLSENRKAQRDQFENTEGDDRQSIEASERKDRLSMDVAIRRAVMRTNHALARSLVEEKEITARHIIASGWVYSISHLVVAHYEGASRSLLAGLEDLHFSEFVNRAMLERMDDAMRSWARWARATAFLEIKARTQLRRQYDFTLCNVTLSAEVSNAVTSLRARLVRQEESQRWWIMIHFGETIRRAEVVKEEVQEREHQTLVHAQVLARMVQAQSKQRHERIAALESVMDLSAREHILLAKEMASLRELTQTFSQGVPAVNNNMSSCFPSIQTTDEMGGGVDHLHDYIERLRGRNHASRQRLAELQSYLFPEDADLGDDDIAALKSQLAALQGEHKTLKAKESAEFAYQRRGEKEDSKSLVVLLSNENKRLLDSNKRLTEENARLLCEKENTPSFPSSPSPLRESSTKKDSSESVTSHDFIPSPPNRGSWPDATPVAEQLGALGVPGVVSE